MAIQEVAREGDVPPGGVIRVWVNDEPVGIYNIGGELFAIGDTCTHEDFSLSDGEIIEDHEVECALHGSRFDLRSGRVYDAQRRIHRDDAVAAEVQDRAKLAILLTQPRHLLL